MAIEPFSDTGLDDNNGNATPDIEVVLAKVPAGKLLVVEHISGQLAVRDGGVVDWIQAASQGIPGGVVYLPVHFVSSVGQFSATQGIGRWHQFGSPARLYVPGETALSFWQRDAIQPRPNGDNLVVRFRHRVFGRRVSAAWDPDLSGLYDDGAPKVPCAVLLHELEHAARYFRGQECTSQGRDENGPVARYDEALASRAELVALPERPHPPAHRLVRSAAGTMDTLARLAALFDRLARYEPAATIAGFALSPLAAAGVPKITTAITHLRDVLG